MGSSVFRAIVDRSLPRGPLAADVRARDVHANAPDPRAELAVAAEPDDAQSRQKLEEAIALSKSQVTKGK